MVLAMHPGLFPLLATQSCFFFFFAVSGPKSYLKWCTNSEIHHRGRGLDTRLQSADPCAEPWVVKPLSEGCVHTVVTDGILIT